MREDFEFEKDELLQERVLRKPQDYGFNSFLVDSYECSECHCIHYLSEEISTSHFKYIVSGTFTERLNPNYSELNLQGNGTYL